MGERKVDWNGQADMYSQFALCELDDTRGYLDAIGVSAGDGVLDVCCGPGRISVLCAERGANVVGIDSAEKMLGHARANADAMGVAGRCDFRLLDWEHVLPGQNLEAADVVIASRCRAMMDVGKLSALAKRTVGVQIFANAPSIPALLGVLFSGCGEPGAGEGAPAGGPGAGADSPAGGGGFGGPGGMPGAGFGAPGAGGPGGFGGPGKPGGPRADGPGAKKAIYLKIAEKAFDAGYEPNVRCFPERFRKTFADEAAAVAWVASLKPERAEGNMERLALNVAPFCTPADGGVEFCIATRAAIVWWNVA